MRRLSIVFLFLFLGSHTYAQSIKELEEKLKNAREENQAEVLNQLSEAYLSVSAAKSIQYAEQALNLAKQTHNTSEEAYAVINLASGYEEQKNYKSAVLNYQKSLSYFEGSEEYKMTGYLFNKLGKNYAKENKYNESAEALKKSVKNYELAKDKRGAANVNAELGDLYFTQKKFEPSINEYRKALKSYEELKQPRQMVNMMGRMGTSYSNLGDYTHALEFMDKALTIARDNQFTAEAEIVAKNREIVKKNQAKGPSESIQLQHQQLLDEKNRQAGEINSLIQQKEKSIEEIEQLSIENQVKEYRIKVQQDKITKKQLEIRNKDKEIALLNKDKLIKRAEIQAQKNLILLIVISLVLVSIITFIVTRSLRITRKQKAIIQSQKALVEKKNQHISDSIRYAHRIQQALLPRTFFSDEAIAQHFVLNLPKDVVSGDFYWSYYTEEAIYFAVIDCTGHGVPGALMSTLANDLLDNEFLYNSKASLPENLANINAKLIVKLENETQSDTIDGMDLCICVFHKASKHLRMVGAKNDLYLIRNKELLVLSSTKISLGYDKNTTFKESDILIMPGDVLYLFTDGYMDQKGGPEGKKIMSKGFKQLLLDVHAMDCESQKRALQSHLSTWQGDVPQKDDVLVAGIKFY